MKFPQGIKPSCAATLYSAAKAAPLQIVSSQSAGSGRFFLRWTWWALVPLALVCAAVGTPYFLNHGFLPLGFALQRGFALVCHQRPERSFWIFGLPVAVCARCLGIYLGAAVGLLVRIPRRVAWLFLIAAAAVNLSDVVSESFGLHANWLDARFVLGWALGAAAAMTIASAIRESEIRSEESMV